ncbi:ADP-ribosylation factor family [Ceratobasidium sp. AG-Ba]|nr:ADP-ribosylation factor family [Ceratobasidium sp. AG-Ba]
MSRGYKRPETPPSIILPNAAQAGPSIFDLSSLPSDTPNDKGTGHGGADLSLSDLSMTDPRANPTKGGLGSKWDDDDDFEPDPPFRLFNESPAPKRLEQETQPEVPEDEEEERNADQTVAYSEYAARDDDLDVTELSIHTPQRSVRPVDEESPPPSVHSRSRTAAERREEQLHAALFQLRKMNAVFGDYVGALEAVQGNTERLERQVERTNSILDRYVKLLGQQEQVAKLVLDEEWGGGESMGLIIDPTKDEQIIQERIEQKAREARERKEREERERREREERAREEERALAEQEAQERAEKAAATGRGRGTRGATARGSARGTVRGAATGANASGVGRGAPGARPSSAAGTSKIDALLLSTTTMYHLLKGLHAHLTRKDEFSVLILGLDNAGKTTFLEKTKTLYNNVPGLSPDKIGPTVGQNMGKITLPSATMQFFDLGGQRDIRTIWSKYYDDCHAVIYMIDAADRDRLWDGWEVFETVLAHPQILDVPLLLLANKQDAPNSLSVNDVRASYEAWWQTRRPEGEDGSESAQIGAGMIMGEDQRAASLDVMGVSALEGTGIRDAIDWVFIRVQNSRKR